MIGSQKSLEVLADVVSGEHGGEVLQRVNLSEEVGDVVASQEIEGFSEGRVGHGFECHLLTHRRRKVDRHGGKGGGLLLMMSPAPARAREGTGATVGGAA